MERVKDMQINPFLLNLSLPTRTVTTEITIGERIHFPQFFKTANRLVIVSDASLCSLVQEKIMPYLQQKDVLHIQIPAGEVAKSRETKSYIEDELLHNSCGQDILMVIIGGGTTLDVGGFTAATFGRGVPLIFIPTTLLAMVDASIGGKNAINIGGIKNCIGTIYHPRHVIIDVDFLKTLPLIEMQSGMVEVMKHALLKDQKALEKVLHQYKIGAYVDMIYDSVSFKTNIVKHSVEIPQMRDLLNFGHTVGHAIEFLEGPSCMHGVAVARGIIAESAVAQKRGLLSKKSFEVIYNAINVLHLPLKNSKRFSDALWQQAFWADKKTKRGIPHAVLLHEIGMPYVHDGNYCHPLSLEELHLAIEMVS